MRVFSRIGFDVAPRFTTPERPWTEEYAATHGAFLAAVWDDAKLARRFRDGERLPRGYGVGLDERVIELPWLLAHAPRGRVLDAGSSLNHEHILDRFLALFDSLTIVTLEPEELSFAERGVSYVYADFRELPFRDGWFDAVVSISSLEHVGMDNSGYGSHAQRAMNPDAEVAAAVSELKRVLRPEGSFFVTVPYGAPEDHGWFRQYGRESAEALLDVIGRNAGHDVFAYGPGGWQRSSLAEASGANYRDYLADPRPVSDHAAAARAVCCVRATR